MLLPKEHGAYGQLLVPAATALAAAGLSTGALLVTVTAVTGFLAHEPAAVLIGSRGVRARREQRREATVWLATCGSLGLAALAGALAFMPAATWPSLAGPAVPAAAVAWLSMRKREKTWYGEVAAASALSLVSVPVAMAAGATLQVALMIAVPFVAAFTATTLAVRAIIARVRGGGDPHKAAIARRAAIGMTMALAAGLAAAAATGFIQPAMLVAAAPGLIAAAVLSLYPPPPAQLRTVGWTLVATSIATAAVVILVV